MKITRKFNKLFGFVCLAFLFSLIPLIIYYINFKKYGLSKDPRDWAAFGSYLSGTIGISLGFFSIAFSSISIYFTISIARFIQDKDFNFRSQQSNKDLQLTYAQNKPYPYIDLQRLSKKTSITIQNMGLGPLIIKRIKVVYNGNEEFENINLLFFKELQISSSKNANIIYNSAPNHILAPNSSKPILEITPNNLKSTTKINQTKLTNPSFSDIQLACRNILKDCEIQFVYQDIFENEFTYKKELSFLRG